MRAEGSLAASTSQAENEESQAHTSDHIGPASERQRQMEVGKTERGKERENKENKRKISGKHFHVDTAENFIVDD